MRIEIPVSRCRASRVLRNARSRHGGASPPRRHHYRRTVSRPTRRSAATFAGLRSRRRSGPSPAEARVRLTPSAGRMLHPRRPCRIRRRSDGSVPVSREAQWSLRSGQARRTRRRVAPDVRWSILFRMRCRVSPEQKPPDAAEWSKRISSGTDGSHSGQPSRWRAQWHWERAQEPSALDGNASMSATPPTP
jgi:hypothetical protein